MVQVEIARPTPVGRANAIAFPTPPSARHGRNRDVVRKGECPTVRVGISG
jgi:hypothetical protein